MFDSIFQRHERVALSLSGGKDSLACLYLLKPWWNVLRVYWCNSGDAFPEVVAFMKGVREQVPHFTEVIGRQPEMHAQDGWPSDVVPVLHMNESSTIFGPTKFKVQPRVSCCFRSVMWPTYQQMVADRITCCIRGRRREEEDRTAIVSGQVTIDGMEIVFPIFDWSSSDVYAYLRKQGVAMPSFYTWGDTSVDCMHCTAYWGGRHADYLAAEHPEAFTEYKRRLDLIKQAISDQMQKCEV